jgi:hypothetical protein
MTETLAISDRVELLGVGDDRAALATAVDLVVVPSLSNAGKPLVILEVMHARAADRGVNGRRDT